MAINYLEVTEGVTLKPSPAPSTPQNGDIYYDSTANLFKFYQNGSYVGVGGSGGANAALSNLTSVAINTSLLPGTTNSIDLGSSGEKWANIYFGTQILGPNGSTSVPSYSFSSSTSTGMYSSATNNIDFSINGSNLLNLKSGTMTLGQGTVSGNAQMVFAASNVSSSLWPSVGLHSAANLYTNIPYNSGNSVYLIEANLSSGVGYWWFGSGDAGFGVGTRGQMASEFSDWVMHPDNTYDIGYDQSAFNRPRNIYFGTQTLGVNGTASLPSHSFSSNPSSGVYYDSTNAGVAISVGGTEAAYFTAPSAGGRLQFLNNNGTLGATVGMNGSSTGRLELIASGNTLYFGTNGSTSPGGQFSEFDSSHGDFLTSGDIIPNAPYNGAITTTATHGFNYVTSVPGVPTGVPDNATVNQIPLVLNSSSNVLYFYHSGWNAIGGGGSGANTALSNLASVAINTALIFASGAGYGSQTAPLVQLSSANGGSGIYTDASGDLYLTAEGSVFLHGTGGRTYLTYPFLYFGSTSSAPWIDASGATLQLYGGNSAGGGINLGVDSGNYISTQIGYDSTVVSGSSSSFGQVWTGMLYGFAYGGPGTYSATGTTYSVLYNDNLVNMTNTAARTVTMPEVVTTHSWGIGQVWTIVDAAGTAGTNNITINARGTDTINGASSYVINSNYGSVTIYCTSITSPGKMVAVPGGPVGTPANLYFSTQILGPDGSASVPAYSFSSATNTGIYKGSLYGGVAVTDAGNAVVEFYSVSGGARQIVDATLSTSYIDFNNGNSDRMEIANPNRIQIHCGTASIYVSPGVIESSAASTIIDGNCSIGSGNFATSSAILDLTGQTTKGFLPPTLTTTQRNAISSPAAGLIVFDTTLKELCIYANSQWNAFTMTGPV